MRLRSGFTLRPLGSDFILLAEGAEVVNFNKMLTLNETAAYLWKLLEGKDFSAEQMADFLCAEYDVAREQALADSKTLIAKWQEAGIIE
ncbi:MAG: PqqD family protein [Paludibacteraceae bacterium]|nr:PqqD family protein [Paludibacteraceae bacterium]